MKPDPSDERELLDRLRQGEDLALNRLIERWERPLFSFAWRYTGHAADAQDLVAETFVRLYQQRQRLRPDTNVSAWLFTTLTNLCHNRHRWKRRHPMVSIEESTEGDIETRRELAVTETTPSRSAERDESMETLRGAIDRLPHDQKTTLLLYYFEDLSYREIADITGCSERGVETRLYRARRQLRRDLEPLLAHLSAL